MWSRIRLVPFDVYIPPEERDVQLGDKLQAEASGILAWAVRGAVEWFAERLGVCEEVERQTELYRAESDLMGQFIADACVLGPTERCSVADLYAAYVRWCEESGERPQAKRNLGTRLKDRGLTGGKSGSVRYWRGIGLRVSMQPPSLLWS